MPRKKILLILAVGAALVAPLAASAQTGTIYGKLYPYVLDERGSGATETGAVVSTLAAAPSGSNAIRNILGLTAGNSRLGFRGEQDLGGGLKVMFQFETTVSVDTGGGGSSSAFWRRNTFVGLGGALGTVRLGFMDTIFKDYGDTIGMLGVSSGTFLSTSDVLRKTGFGTSSASSFHLRRANSIQYESPEIGGFQAGLQYSTDEAEAGTRDPKVISLGLKYDSGPFYVAIAHEIHDDLFGGSRNVTSSMRNNGATDPTNSKDTATQLTLEWRLNKQHKFEFDVIRKAYKENASVAGRFESYKNTAYLLAMENRWSDQWRTAAHFVKATAGSCSVVGRACVTDGLEGTKISLGAAYYLSKRTYAFAAVSRITSGKSARYNNAELGDASNPGEDIGHAALGLAHSF